MDEWRNVAILRSKKRHRAKNSQVPEGWKGESRWQAHYLSGQMGGLEHVSAVAGGTSTFPCCFSVPLLLAGKTFRSTKRPLVSYSSPKLGVC